MIANLVFSMLKSMIIERKSGIILWNFDSHSFILFTIDVMGTNSIGLFHKNITDISDHNEER